MRPYPHLGGQFGGFTKHVYYFENALELLDQAGEWYLDETQNVLYYKPRSGEDMTKATVVAPVLETVVSINGHQHVRARPAISGSRGSRSRTRPSCARASPGSATRRRASTT